MIDERKRREAKAYRARWVRVMRYQINQARQASPELRLKQLALLFRLAKSMNLKHPIDDPELVAVRARWTRLKRGVL